MSLLVSLFFPIVAITNNNLLSSSEIRLYFIYYFIETDNDLLELALSPSGVISVELFNVVLEHLLIRVLIVTR